ncbi:MAG: diaminopimelate decarboxylase [Candidatus Marinimicrobia bacterium]|nr:diaminopimelate decarboxylase [Candidatus Neomarinimicrobiota bacterium]MBT3762939.1 diaminopimelate decarboxylase [Candidatus Neomarinimicrobiota bacterium]MBT4810117.1 diaminopimelate decarboxylase [Candidatus Neomarinimicrobiota bacterium]MBT6129902.1 diaminopimelate decarboxylase [Candidatus Neomarinimicrobiota bacterium]MBT6638464.1 diaminopimelate decarboxylase [Candidatus Neomarinimicrobiota bacterium]
MTMNIHPLRELIKDKGLMAEIANTYGTPSYIYVKDRVEHNISRLTNALNTHFTNHHICYAIKANSNPNLLKVMKSVCNNLGGDCSSPGEIYAAELGGIAPEDCIYTGNYESIHDLSFAMDKGCYLNLDDETSLDRLLKIGIPERISFRLNPGFGKGTFSQITTAGEDAKFGIPAEKIITAYQKAKDAGVKRFGLQCMAGSGNLDESYFIELLTAIIHHTKRIETKLNIQFEFISMGGGLGIPYRDEESPLNYDRLFSQLSKVLYTNYPEQKTAPALWVEPGKSIIGDAGFILSSVTGSKNSYKNFVGIDAGMETLMRPALYGAYHRIYKVGDHGVNNGSVDFTGPICENTDRIAIGREFPNVIEGDLIAIMDAGAYGYAMSHNFNTRPRTAEILLDGSSHRLIRRRETIEDIFSNCHV